MESRAEALGAAEDDGAAEQRDKFLDDRQAEAGAAGAPRAAGVDLDKGQKHLLLVGGRNPWTGVAHVDYKHGPRKIGFLAARFQRNIEFGESHLSELESVSDEVVDDLEEFDLVYQHVGGLMGKIEAGSQLDVSGGRCGGVKVGHRLADFGDADDRCTDLARAVCQFCVVENAVE